MGVNPKRPGCRHGNVSTATFAALLRGGMSEWLGRVSAWIALIAEVTRDETKVQ